MLFYTEEERPVVEALREMCWSKDLIRSYLTYLHKIQRKNRLADRGRTHMTDFQKSRVYKSEWAFERIHAAEIKQFASEKEAQAYANKILKSATWKKIKSPRARGNTTVQSKNFRGNTAGTAGWDGTVHLDKNSGMNEYTLIHELAHVAGYMDHDAGFVDTLLKLVSRFMGRDKAATLKAEFKRRKVKISVKTKSPKMPDAWLNMHNRLVKARNARG